MKSILSVRQQHFFGGLNLLQPTSRLGQAIQPAGQALLAGEHFCEGL